MAHQLVSLLATTFSTRTLRVISCGLLIALVRDVNFVHLVKDEVQGPNSWRIR